MLTKKILITGLSGFKGPFVGNQFLEAGYQVVGHLMRGEPLNDRFDYVQGDLLDKVRLKASLSELMPEGIIHLAGVSFPAHQPSIDFYNVNTIGTTNLVEAVVRSGIHLGKLILASRTNVYGNVESDCISEDFPCKSLNHFAARKLAMECMASAYFDKISMLIVRAFNCIGPGQRTELLVPKIVEHFRRRKNELRLGNIQVCRDFVDAIDASRFYLSMFERDSRGEVFNLCYEQVTSIEKIIDELTNNITGHHLQVLVDSRFVRANDPKIVKDDCKKAQDILGFRTQSSRPETLDFMRLNHD